MNRRFQKIIFLILIFCLMVGISQSAIASAGTFRTTADGVRVRSEPSTDANVVTLVHTGTNVEVLEHDPSGWSKVQVGNTTGFIRSDFLRAQTGNGSAPATFSTTDGVNLRSSASTTSNANILRTVVAGTSVEVLEHDPSGWSKVRVDGTTGFIRSDYLTRGGGGAPAPAPAAAGQAVGTLKTTSAVNLRSGPSTNDGIIRTVASGTNVEILEQQANGWSKVRHSGSEGFIRSDFLSESGAPPAQASSLKTTSAVNLRSGPSTNNSTIRTLAANTSVEVLEQQSNGWSSVRHNGTSGFIRSDFLSAAGASSSGAAIGTLRTVTGVNFRSGPSTSHSKIDLLAVNTEVEILENQSNGWSRVRHNGREGFIKSEFLGAGARTIELIDWSTARSIVPTGVNLRVVDVRTGITFNLRGFSKSGHMDSEPPTQEDTNAILRSRNGVWAWAPRPVWVTVGDRTFAAALNGMPHDVSTIRDNGMNGHLCLHFNNTVTNSKSYQANLNAAVLEAYAARPN